MGAIGDFLRRINPFDGIPASSWDAGKQLIGQNVNSPYNYVFDGFTYPKNGNSWKSDLLQFVQFYEFSPTTVLKQAHWDKLVSIAASSTLTINQSPNNGGLTLLAGFRENGALVSVIYKPDYSNPEKSISYIANILGVPTFLVGQILPFAQNKANNAAWLNGALTLLIINHINLKMYNYDIVAPLQFIENKFNPLKRTDTNINPATGQPYGFGSVDLDTGEVVIDGVVVKAGMDISQLKKAITPDTASTNIWPLVLVLGGAVLLRKKKRKNK